MLDKHDKTQVPRKCASLISFGWSKAADGKTSAPKYLCPKMINLILMDVTSRNMSKVMCNTIQTPGPSAFFILDQSSPEESGWLLSTEAALLAWRRINAGPMASIHELVRPWPSPLIGHSIKSPLCNFSDPTAYKAEIQAKPLKCKIKAVDKTDRNVNRDKDVWLRELESSQRSQTGIKLAEQQRYKSLALY